ncbi:ribonuclease P/MRP protein subunit POP5 isoform 2 [Anopheles sinensis]|uniref:Ribonuclease P/MRP protein subunit POP5 isoform 2 n=1 Tax=Anopheles sinensis TaxID=74873 RepID=A0A084WGL7_ANOSI|nr:ribonuclease P/MRP protein subunit POP5 isoform 2 [Anopheles sinensis]
MAEGTKNPAGTPAGLRENRSRPRAMADTQFGEIPFVVGTGFRFPDFPSTGGAGGRGGGWKRCGYRNGSG